MSKSINKEADSFDKMVRDFTSHGYMAKSEVRRRFNALIKSEKRAEICICAAVKADNGTIYRGHRHGDCMILIHKEGKEIGSKVDDQGFITSFNRFVSRSEGRKLQDKAGIPSADPEGYRGTTLFSEDLY